MSAQQQLNIQDLMAMAEQASGLSDWGDEHFRLPLKIATDSINAEGHLNARGFASMQNRFVDTMVQRLQVLDDQKRHPEILREEIVRPIIVTGNGRSGTTLFHNLLSCDPDHRPPRFWEMKYPSPPPEAATYETDPRIERAERLLAGDGLKSGAAMKKHAFGATRPEECTFLLELSFCSGAYGSFCLVPSFTAWRENPDSDFRPAYGLHRRVLQQLQWRGPKGRWVLKAPEHMFHIPELLDIYPDAIVIQVHRDPAKAIPSLVSLVSQMHQQFTDAADVNGVRDARMNYSKILNRLPEVRASLDRPGRFFDVHYLDLHHDPIGTLEQLYERMGLPFTEAYRQALQDYLAVNKKGRFGEHVYSLADFGLSYADIDREFGPYLHKCGVKLERS